MTLCEFMEVGDLMPKYIPRAGNPRPKKRKQSAGSAKPVGQQAALFPGKLSDVPKIKAAFERLRHGTDSVEIGGSIEIDDDIHTLTMADAAKEIDSVEYLVRGVVPYGMVTGGIAEPGVGKSAFALGGLARPIMTGCDWFNGSRGPKPGFVLWCATESDMAITKDRMEKWCMPFDKMLLPFADDPLASIDLLDDAHLARVQALICKYQVHLMVVDSLRGSHDGDENCSRVGKVLKNLSGIAERTRAAIFVVHHTKKLMEGEEVSANSSRGSNAILALFRAQLGFDKPDPESDWVRVRMLKQNLGLAPQPFGMRVTGTGLEFGEAPKKPGKDTRKANAIEFLHGVLADGKWHLRDDVMQDAAQFDLSSNAVQRAREELGITLNSAYIRKRPDNRYEWRLPPAH